MNIFVKNHHLINTCIYVKIVDKKTKTTLINAITPLISTPKMSHLNHILNAPKKVRKQHNTIHFISCCRSSPTQKPLFRRIQVSNNLTIDSNKLGNIADKMFPTLGSDTHKNAMESFYYLSFNENVEDMINMYDLKKLSLFKEKDHLIPEDIVESLSNDQNYIDKYNKFVKGLNNGFNIMHELWTKICDRFMYDMIIEYLEYSESTLYQEVHGNPWKIYVDNLDYILSFKNKNFRKTFYRCICENFGTQLLDRISTKFMIKFL